MIEEMWQSSVGNKEKRVFREFGYGEELNCMELHGQVCVRGNGLGK
jgi:hypothetical protein